MFIAVGHIFKAAFNKKTLNQVAKGERQDVNPPAKTRMDRGCESQPTPSFRGEDLFSTLRSSCEINSQGGFGVGRAPRDCPVHPSRPRCCGFHAGQTPPHRHSSASTFLHLPVFFSIFLSLSPPSNEAGLPAGCEGRRCETAEPCMWAALLWVSLCMSALRALGRAGSGCQWVTV